MYDKLIKAIEDNSEEVDFAPFGEGLSEEWIVKAEKRLNIYFPESYKWWLRNYNGGEVYGEEIYSIYGVNFDEVVGGDIVYINELARKNNADNIDKLFIFEPNDERYYFDLSKGLIGGEYEIYELRSGKMIAKSFADFLYNIINE